jgi:hypothetical protein
VVEAQHGAVGLGDDEDDIEAEGHLQEVVILGIRGEGTHDASELSSADDFFGRHKVSDIASLDFDGDQFPLVFEDEVSFGVLDVEVAFEDLRALRDEIFLGEAFAPSASAQA